MLILSFLSTNYNRKTLTDRRSKLRRFRSSSQRERLKGHCALPETPVTAAVVSAAGVRHRLPNRQHLSFAVLLRIVAFGIGLKCGLVKIFGQICKTLDVAPVFGFGFFQR